MNYLDLIKSSRKSIIQIIIELEQRLVYGKMAKTHLNPNMDRQEKYKAQSESEFFADGSAMRQPAEGTVARGLLRDDIEFYEGKRKNGKFLEKIPVEIDMDLMKRGQERYNIYCSPCHSRVGDGRGIMIDKGYLPPPSFHMDRIREMPDG